MTWVLVVHLIGLVLAAVMVLETFREAPLWLRPEKSASPRQRRWLGSALVLITSGGLATWATMVGAANLALVGFGLPVLGLVVLVVGIAKGPTDQELDRRARLLGRQVR